MKQNLKLPTQVLEPLILNLSIFNPSFFLKVKDHLFTGNAKNKSYFNDIKYQYIFNILVKFFNRYKKIPKLSTLKAIINKVYADDEELKVLLLALADEIYIKKDIDAEYIEDEVVRFIKEAKAYESIILAQADIDTGNFGSMLKRIEEAVRINFDKDLGLEIDNVDEVYKRLEEMNSLKKVSSGYSHFDNVIDGGFFPKELTVFSSVPGGFKSGTLLNIGVNAYLNGNNVLYYTFENSIERSFIRAYSNLINFSKKELLLDKETVKEKIKSITDLTEGRFILKEYNANSVSSDDLMAHIEELKLYKDFKPDIVIIDYLLIMKTNDKTLSSENSYKYYKTVAEEVRNIGKTYNVPVVSATQINREGMGDQGGTKAILTSKKISESRGILDTADVFIILIQTARDKANNKLFFYIDKNRNENTGIKLEFEVDYEHMRLKESSILKNLEEK